MVVLMVAVVVGGGTRFIKISRGFETSFEGNYIDM